MEVRPILSHELIVGDYLGVLSSMHHPEPSGGEAGVHRRRPRPGPGRAAPGRPKRARRPGRRRSWAAPSRPVRSHAPAPAPPGRRSPRSGAARRVRAAGSPAPGWTGRPRPPGAAKPLHRMPQARVTGKRPQGVEHVVQACAAQPVQQGAGVLQQDPWLAALGEQLGDELVHPLVARVEHRGVVVVAEAGVLQHPLQVADHRRRAQLRSGGRDERLVHVQGDRERAVDARDVHRRLTADHRPASAGGDRRLDQLLRTAQVRQAVHVLRQLFHGPLLAGRLPGCSRRATLSPAGRGCGWIAFLTLRWPHSMLGPAEPAVTGVPTSMLLDTGSTPRWGAGGSQRPRGHGC
jgi:hypothetical protein